MPDPSRLLIIDQVVRDRAEALRHEAPTATLPRLLDQVVNFGRSVVTHAMAGFPEADADTVAARLAICEACPNLIRPSERCGILPGSDAASSGCGCFVRNKARWLDQHCPAGKW